MSNLTTRAGKGSPLTNNELDANFTNLNADKVEIGGDLSGTSTAPNVAKIQGRAVSADTPENGEKLVWNGTAWEPSVDPTGEPIGHANKADSTISFDSGTRTFTIAPVAASFTVWCKGVKHTYTSAQTVVIPDTTGLHFIYFNASGVLSTQMSYFTWEEHAPTAYIYWNATAQQAVYFGDERHGITLDWQTHEYLHRTRGAAIASGFGASGYTTTGAGSTDADAQIDIGGGTFFDEDLQVDIVSTNTPVAGTWQQDLSGPARIPVLYLSGSAWVIDAPTDFPFKVVSGVPQYNLYSGGTWSASPVANNGYFVSWILATHNLTYPVVAVISQAATNQVSEAEAMTFEGLTLSGFPSVEFRPLYKVIYQHKTSFANNIKASTIAVYDLRSISAAGVAAALVQDHGNLSGLGDDDHAQYLHVSAVRSPSAAVTNSFLPSQASQSGKYLTTDGSNPSWGAIPSGSLTFTGDVTGTGNTGSSTTLTLANSGVTAGTFTKVTVDAKGRVTTGASASSSDITTALGFTPENVSNKAVANGYASLDSSGKVPSNQLPSYVDDVLEYANLAAFPGTGETGKIYIAIDTAKTYRWSGSAYVEITASPGSTDAVPEGSTNLYFTNARARAAVSASGSLSYSTATGIFSYTQPTNVSAFTNDSGYLTGITGGQVTTALGYTPPQPNGTGATGTWSISISGNAATVSSITSAQVTTALGYTPYNATNPAGYTTNVGTVTSVSGTGTVSGLTLTGSVTSSGSLTLGGTLSLTSGQVTTALGFTPYNATNPSGYITGITSGMVTTALGYTPPQPTGTGASGTWGISITGSAGSVSWANISAGVRSEYGNLQFQPGASSFSGLRFLDTSGNGAGWFLIRGTSDTDVYTAEGITLVADKGWLSLAQRETAGKGVRIMSGTTSTERLKITTAGDIQFVNGNSFTYGGNAILHAGNYNDYAPSKTGTGANGTWSINITGSAGSASNSTTVGGLSPAQLFNNMGNNHGSPTDFNSIPGYGSYFVQGTTNGPGTGAGQFYGITLGLGNDYAYSSFALQLAIPRYAYNSSADRYLSIRNREGGTWSAWSKISAGYADTAGSATDSTKLPLSGGTLTGAIRAPQITAGGSINTDANFGVQGTSHLTGQIYYGGTVGNVNSWSSTSTSVSGVHTFSASQFIFNRYGYGSQPLIDMQSSSITFGQPAYAGSGITVNNAAGDGRGINLYSGSPTSPTYGLFFATTGNFGTYGAVSGDWATYFTMSSDSGRGWVFRNGSGNVAAISNQGNMTLNSHFEQGNNIARPNVSWSVGGGSTGMVIFYLPGTTGNYGMVHMVFDIYEYNSNAVSTVIVGGHNWSTSWYNVGANVIGQCGKEVRLGVKNGRFCVVFGTAGSSWEYGTIVLRKIHNGSFYDNIMNMVGDWESAQTTTESFTNITGDLRALRTPASLTAGGVILSGSGFRSNRWMDYDGNFLFRQGTGSGVTRHLNLADSENDPSDVVTFSGISWGQRSDGNPYYMIYTRKYDRGSGFGNYTRLQLAWHTGIDIGSTYGGTRFYNNSPWAGSEIFSVGSGDSNVRVVNTLYSYAYRGNGNVAGTGEATYHPAGIYSTSTNWLYGTMYRNGSDTYSEGGSIYSTNQIVCSQNYGRGLNGVYDSYRFQHVWMMGTSYQLAADGTTTGNAYGIAWSHPNAGGVAGNLDSHGMLILINGGFASSMSYSIRASGNVTAYSDERLKTNWREMPENYVERLAQVKVGIYDRIDGEKITQVGIGAQSFQRLLPEAITKATDEMGTLSVSYGNAAMASAVELAKELVMLKKELAEIKSRLH